MCGSDAGIGSEWCNGVFPEEEASIAVVCSWSIAVSNLETLQMPCLTKIWSFQSLQAQGGKMIHIWEGFASTQGWKDQFVEGQCEMVSLGF